MAAFYVLPVLLWSGELAFSACGSPVSHTQLQDVKSDEIIHIHVKIFVNFWFYAYFLYNVVLEGLQEVMYIKKENLMSYTSELHHKKMFWVQKKFFSSLKVLLSVTFWLNTSLPLYTVVRKDRQTSWDFCLLLWCLGIKIFLQCNCQKNDEYWALTINKKNCCYIISVVWKRYNSAWTSIQKISCVFFPL